jgi:hypothetical protein
MPYTTVVNVTVYADGQRLSLPPGAPVPASVAPADIDSLLALKAITAIPEAQGEEPKVSTAKGAKK